MSAPLVPSLQREAGLVSGKLLQEGEPKISPLCILTVPANTSCCAHPFSPSRFLSGPFFSSFLPHFPFPPPRISLPFGPEEP